MSLWLVRGNTSYKLRLAALTLAAVALLGCHKKLHPLPPPTASLTVSPETIQRGQSAKLAWQTTNATEIEIDPTIGRVDALGSTIVSPLQSTTYQLIAKGSGGTTQVSATITVTEPQKKPPSPPLAERGTTVGRAALKTSFSRNKTNF